LRDPNDWRYVLAERVRALYADLFAIDSSINAAPESEVRGALLRITGKDEETVARYYATFKALSALAKFDPKPSRAGVAPALDDGLHSRPKVELPVEENIHRRRSEYHYNIQIH